MAPQDAEEVTSGIFYSKAKVTFRSPLLRHPTSFRVLRWAPYAPRFAFQSSVGGSACGVILARCLRWPSDQSRRAVCAVTRFYHSSASLHSHDVTRRDWETEEKLTTHTTSVFFAHLTRTWISCDKAMWSNKNLRR